jgi:hypothetical protein
MKYKVFVNNIQGRTIVDEWTPSDNKTISDLALIYSDEYVKVDEYTNEGHFVTSVYLAPNDEGDMEITTAKRTVLVGEKF